MTINLDIFETMALATIVFYIGLYLRKKVKFQNIVYQLQ